MKKSLMVSIAALAAAVSAVPASAAVVVWQSTFENVPGAPGNNGFSFFTSADGWTAPAIQGVDNVIELQNNVAGSPSTGAGLLNGGKIFVELDSRSTNSTMQRTIDKAGIYDLSFIYSPRPNVSAQSNGIEVLLDGELLSPPGTIGIVGGSNTSWSIQQSDRFQANAGSVITFRAVGTGETLGGYVDNITLSAVPEPATWGLMILGFGMIGAAMRRREKVSVAYA
jgi:hypothetical protein